MERQRHGEPPDYADLLLRGGSNLAATIYEPLSTAHLKSCTVDFDSRPDKKAVNLVQYDQTIPVLCVSLKKGGTEYKVPSDADVNIRMDKRDGYHVYNPALGVNAERTIAYFAVTPQMSTGWGDYYPIVEITVGGGIAGSAPIWLHFDRNPLPENAIISSDEYKTIQQLLKDVTAVKADTEQIKAQTEAVRDQAKGFADNAKNSADKAQTLVDGMPSDYSQAMKDIGTLKNQMQRAYPDDSTIGENTWSSKNIVDMLCPEIKESGNPVLCYPVAGYPLGVKASWEPVQEGTGTPYPAGGGKNLWGDLIQNTFVSQLGFSSGPSGAKTTGKIPCTEGDNYTLSCATSFAAEPGNIGVLAYFDASDTMLTRSGNTYQRAFTLTAPANVAYLRASCYKETDADNVQLEKSATATAYAPYENIRPIKGRDSVKVERCGENLLNIKPFNKVTKNGITYEYIPDGGIHMSGTATANADGPMFPIWHLPPGKYCGLNSGAGVSASVVVQRNARDYWILSNSVFEILAGDVCKYFYLLVTSGTTIDKTVYPYIVSGTTAPTTYTPYIGQTNTLTLPETVYGGEVDAVTGDGQETWKILTLDGTEQWMDNGSVPSTKQQQWALYGILEPYSAVLGISSHFDNKKKFNEYPFNFVRISSTSVVLHVASDGPFATVNDLKSYLAAQKAAGTPVQIAYKLSEPVPFTATGAQPIPALAGTNTVLTDADSATVTGRADPIKRIEDLEAAVASIN
jgi:hypothetical protein